MTDDLIGGKELASFSSPFHKVKAKEDFLYLSKTLPPMSREIKYNEIASVEHKRMINYGRLTGVLFGIIVAYTVTSVQFIKDIIASLVLEIQVATGATDAVQVDMAVRATAGDVSLWIAALATLVAGYYMIKFVMSLGQRFIIYRTGKNPISIPLPLTGDSMQLLATINKKVKAASGVSKSEVQKIIGEQIRGMLDNRVKMQKTMMDSLKVQALAATTDEQKARVKALMEENIAKLEEQDQQIDVELKKTGLNKEDIFKKYRIKAPKEEFLDAILKEGGLD